MMLRERRSNQGLTTGSASNVPHLATIITSSIVVGEALVLALVVWVVDDNYELSFVVGVKALWWCVMVSDVRWCGVMVGDVKGYSKSILILKICKEEMS
jgi:hypothetical protein